MFTFIENILKGVKQWTENELHKITYVTSNNIAELNDKVSDLNTNLSEKYTLPSGGIPKADLSSSVQDSLNKADSAVQDISGKLDKSSVKQNTGTSTNDVMSQKSITDLASEKLDKTSVKQTAGTSTTDVMSQKTVTDLVDNVNLMYYGVEFDRTNSSPSCTRIGNMNLHRTLPIQNKMRGCILNDSGEVVKYLNEDDWTNETRDGFIGQVMVEIPMHYRKFETDGNILRILISECDIAGFHQVPKSYVSAYEATIDRTNNKLASVVNTTTQYRGGSNNPSWDDTYKTELGRPATSQKIATFRNMARNRKSNSVEWNCMTYDLQKTLYWLFVIEYATRNTQAAFNASLDANGFHQGGLGIGVSNLPTNDWNNFNGFNAFIPCGVSDSLGNYTGQFEYTMSDGESFTKTVYVPRYHGIENVFGHIIKYIDGIIVEKHPDSETGNSFSKVYVSSDPSKFNSSDVNDFKYVGNELRTNGTFITDIIFGENGDIIPTVGGGSNSTYYCDNITTNVPTVTTIYRYSAGGNANGGNADGFVCLRDNIVDAYTSNNVGARLVFLPTQTIPDNIATIIDNLNTRIATLETMISNINSISDSDINNLR